jgi:hypothetical protein
MSDAPMADRTWPSREEFRRMTPAEVNRFLEAIGAKVRVLDIPPATAPRAGGPAQSGTTGATASEPPPAGVAASAPPALTRWCQPRAHRYDPDAIDSDLVVCGRCGYVRPWLGWNRRTSLDAVAEKRNEASK